MILTAYATIELAVAAIKQGADHFLTKPVEFSALLVVLSRLFEKPREFLETELFGHQKGAFTGAVAAPATRS